MEAFAGKAKLLIVFENTQANQLMLDKYELGYSRCTTPGGSARRVVKLLQNTTISPDGYSLQHE